MSSVGLKQSKTPGEYERNMIKLKIIIPTTNHERYTALNK
jgi:hypothetical protein